MSETGQTTDPERRRGLIASVLQKLNLRFPGLFVVLAAVLLIDLLVPDFIPWLDEIVLALLTAIFGLWREKKDERKSEIVVDGQVLPPKPPETNNGGGRG